MTGPANICLPMQLHAFVLNPFVADDAEAKIAPITQPNYTFLRLDHQVIQNDVTDHVDLHYTSPRQNNSRMSNIETGETITTRSGVYLSWTMPRMYRTGAAATNGSGPVLKDQGGFRSPAKGKADYTVPEFRAVPNRWLIIRHIDTSSASPTLTDPVARDVQCQAWVVESDLQTSLDSIDETKDIQVDYAPFLAPSSNNDTSSVEQQAEVFIGSKADLEKWTPDDLENPDGKVRVKPLSLLNSSNHLFADFQHHNGNCFSIQDDFKYIGEDNKEHHLQYAKASYYVLGWHSDPSEDPFAMAVSATSRQARMESLNLKLSDMEVSEVHDWLTSKESAATVCHGALYDVVWTSDRAPDINPARDASRLLNRETPKEPLAVGTTATDALLAYINAHRANDVGEIKELEDDIWAIRTLLLAQDDGADAQLEAQDMLYDYGFERSDGGGEWHVSGAGNGVTPSINQRAILQELAQKQSALDNMQRTVRQLQWQLFSIWWRFVSGAGGDPTSPTTQTDVLARETTPLLNRLKKLNGSAADTNSLRWLSSEVSRLSQSPEIKVENGTAPSFYQQKDPTLMIGGIASAWPADFLDKLATRLSFQVPSLSPSTDEAWSQYDGANGVVEQALAKMPERVRVGATRLLREFPALHNIDLKPTSGLIPLYHDHGPSGVSATADAASPWRDRWNGQPWFPLFVEWQAQYYHIPYENWSLEERDSASILCYGIKNQKRLLDQEVAISHIAGRTLILPQPSFSLKSSIDTLLQNLTDDDLRKYGLAPTERDRLKDDINMLPFLSFPLAGLHDHLITRLQGSHIKPSQRPPGEEITSMTAAISASTAIGIGDSEISLMGAETHVTPYGRSIEALSTKTSSNYSLFKPVTHGQLKFTQINIIDKFGQAISALDPTPSITQPHVAPALSEYHKCQEISPNVPNVIASGLPPPACEFIQLPPAINQASRLNSAWVVQDSPQSSTWRPTYEWENPIYGWILNNYLDNALQIFLPDGTFYREIVSGGHSGDFVSPGYSPFQKPEAPSISPQLDLLIEKLENITYLRAFKDMIDGAAENIPAAPTTYAQYLNAIIGKPYALVNMGWSLDLAAPPLHNESSLNFREPDISLLPLSNPELPSGRDRRAPPLPTDRPLYSFPMKLGDRDRVYDGLIGFWSSTSDRKSFDLDRLYTYWDSPNVKDSPTVAIGIQANGDTNYPRLNAFHISADQFDDVSKLDTQNTSYSDYVMQRDQNLKVFTALVDPFTAVHAYTGILPIQSLALPVWTLQSAMDKMTAFFRMGPLMLTKDVPDFTSDHVLKPDDPPDKTFPAVSVDIPAVSAGQWEWLQPYEQPIGIVSTTDGSGAKDVVPPPYMGLSLGKPDTRPRFEDGPYTSIEGFLRLVAPIMKPAPPIK